MIINAFRSIRGFPKIEIIYLYPSYWLDCVQLLACSSGCVFKVVVRGVDK